MKAIPCYSLHDSFIVDTCSKKIITILSSLLVTLSSQLKNINKQNYCRLKTREAAKLVESRRH